MLDELAHGLGELEVALLENRLDRSLPIQSGFAIRDVILLKDVGVDIVPHDVVALHVDGQGARKAELSEPQEPNFHHRCPRLMKSRWGTTPHSGEQIQRED